MPNRTLPIWNVPEPGNRLKSMQPPPMTSAVSAAAIRSQNVLRFRAATRSSRFTIGRQFIAPRVLLARKLRQDASQCAS